MKKQQPNAKPNQRDHLFISYATEDWLFVEWLALRLTAEGYKVWCDRFKLLGGESYPKKIDAAIKWRTFRFLAVLSHQSINKPNPLKERTLALNLARERKEDFVVPINLDGISPTDLDWMVSDLTFIPFHLSWAQGLAQLLKMLEAANASREFPNSRSVAASWFESRELVKRKQERLWLNVAEIREMPRNIYRYEARSLIPDEDRLQSLKGWPHIGEGQEFWAFEPPPRELSDKYQFAQAGQWRNWHSLMAHDIALRYLAVRLLNVVTRSVGLARGLVAIPDEDTSYFPDGLLPNNRLPFNGYDRKATWTRCVGVRNFRTLAGTESCRYHLAPCLRVWLGHGIGNVVQVQIRLHITDLEGKSLEPIAALRRRKRICRTWWNHQWLARTFAVLQFLAGNRSSIQIGEGTQRLVISGLPRTARIGWGLDESQLGPTKSEPEESDGAVLDLGDEEPNESEGAVDE